MSTGETSCMTAPTDGKIGRADVVGRLLRPTYLRQARQGVHEGRLNVT